jgi:hypothetical protein
VAASDAVELKTTPLGRHYLIALPAGLAYFLACRIADHRVLLEGVDRSTRSALYISLTTTCGALLGFSITAVTVLLALGGGRRIDWLYKDKRFAYARTIFLGAIYMLASATLFFSVLIVADAACFGKAILESLGTVAASLVILRVARVVRLLADLLHIAITDRSDPSPPNPPFTRSVDEK